jgi:hypothetical protein
MPQLSLLRLNEMAKNVKRILCALGESALIGRENDRRGRARFE